MIPGDRPKEPTMNVTDLYREEIYTDRQVGTIRQLTPVNADGSTDNSRKVLYVGQAQLVTAVGAVPLAFEINAHTLKEAVEKFSDKAKEAVNRAVKELQEMRREAASSIVIPEPGAGGYGPGGVSGGGKIQVP